jgi:methyltransferase
MSTAILLLAFVTLQRLGELWLAQANTRRLLAMGGVEHGRRHYAFIVALHTAWLTGLWVLAWRTAPEPAWIALYVVVQGLRVWTLASLGRRWTTRVIVVPGETAVRRGPYRFMRHPNYAVVIGEIAILPLVFGMPLYAAIFTVLNAAVLFVRVRIEDAAWRAESRG